MPSVVRFMLQAFLEIDATEALVAGGEGWLPTAANVNALPEGIGRYVHDLDAQVRELEAELAILRKASKGARGQPQ